MPSYSVRGMLTEEGFFLVEADSPEEAQDLVRMGQFEDFEPVETLDPIVVAEPEEVG